MIVENGTYYLYRHIRTDKNTVFYIGISKKYRGSSHNRIYARAYSTNKRNLFWKSIIKQTPYRVEIILESDSHSFIITKEKEFIKLYGRQDLNTGILCNLTNGGEETANKSIQSIAKQLETAKTNGSYELMVDRMRKYAPKKGLKSYLSAKMVFVYDLTGKYLESFNSITDCSLKYPAAIQNIHLANKNRQTCNGFIYSYNFLGLQLDASVYAIRKPRYRPVIQKNSSGEIIAEFDKMADAAKYINGNKGNILASIKSGGRRKSYGYFWEYKLTG